MISICGVYGSGVPISRTHVPMSYTYEIVTPRVALPLTLTEVKTHLRLDLTDVTDDVYLNLLIAAVADYFESYTSRILINTVFKTYRDKFPYCDGCFSIRKTKVNPSTVGITYLKGGVLTVVPTSDYYVTSESGFPGVYLLKNKSWPNDADERAQAITIQFTAGFGATNASIPSDIKIALLNHIAALFENRGDCSSDACGNSIPSASKKTYDQYLIYSISPYVICRG